MKRWISLLYMLGLLTLEGQAEIYVVTNSDNPIEALSQQEVRDLYLAKSKAFSNGNYAKVYDHRNEVLRQRFLNSLVGMEPRQFDAYWARLVFAGRVLPLNQIDNHDELLASLSSEANALGYVDQEPDNGELKTLLVIDE